MSEVAEEYAAEPENEEIVDAPEGDIVDNGQPAEPDDGGHEGEQEQIPERPQEDPEAVRLAKVLGWKEPTEWKGDTTNYMTAEKYLSIHSKRLNDLPEIQTRAERAEQELARLRREVMERFEEQDTSQLSQLKAERDKAFDLGDKRRYDEINERIEQMQSRPARQPDPEQAQREHVQQVASDGAFQEFSAQNPWFEAGMRGDPDAQPKFEYANFIAQQEYQRLGVANPLELPDAVRRQVFAQIAAKTNQFFPDNKRGKVPQSANGAANRSPAAPRKKGPSFDALPADAKQAFAKLSRSRIYEDTPEGRLEYAREYFAQEQ